MLRSHASDSCRGEWIRTTDPQTPSRSLPKTAENSRDVASAVKVDEGQGIDLPPHPAAALHGPELATALRAKLDAAILSEAWDAVRAIKQRIDELERASVVDLAAERARRR